MEPLELREKLRADGAVRYAGKKGPGMTGDYAADPSWPYNGEALSALAMLITDSRFKYEQVRDALWQQLDKFDGDAYGAYVRTHDNGISLIYFLLGKNANALLNPIPVDTRFAPLNDEVQLDFRPVAAKRIHDRHQPVEAGMAFQRDAQCPRRRPRKLREVPLRGLHFAHHRPGESHQPLPRLGELHRLAMALHHRKAVMRLQRLQLMRKSRLGQMHALGGARDRARFGERDQRAEVADFEHDL